MTDPTIDAAPATPDGLKIERSFPLDFNLTNQLGQHILFTRVAEQKLHLDLENTSRGVLTIPTGTPPANPTEEALVEARQFYLILPPGTLFEPKALTVSEGWQLLFDERRDDAFQAWFLWRTGEEIALQPRHRTRMTLAKVAVDGSGGSRGARAELDYHGLQLGIARLEVSGHRTHYVGVLDEGPGDEPGHGPLRASVVGEVTVLNQAGSLNRPIVRITNNSGRSLPLDEKSRLDVRFPIATPQQPWGLVTTADKDSIHVLSVRQFDSKGTAKAWDHGESKNPVSIIADHTYFWPPILGAPGPLDEGGWIDIELEFQSTAPSGPTAIEVHYTDFDHLASTLRAVAFKSPLVVRDDPQPRIGIGTAAPQKRLHVGAGGAQIDSGLQVKGQSFFGFLQINGTELPAVCFKVNSSTKAMGILVEQPGPSPGLMSRAHDEGACVELRKDQPIGQTPLIVSGTDAEGRSVRCTGALEGSELRASSAKVTGDVTLDGILKGKNRIGGGAATIRGFGTQGDAEFALKFDNKNFGNKGGAIQIWNSTHMVFKTFVVEHPQRADRYLVHATLEGPEGAVYYRGSARLDRGRAEISLPTYFESFTRPDQRTVTLTNVDGFDRLAVQRTDGEKIKDGRFVVVSEDPRSTQEFDWEVKAVRADGPPLEVEPRKRDVAVRGFGPYTYLGDAEREGSDALLARAMAAIERLHERVEELEAQLGAAGRA